MPVAGPIEVSLELVPREPWSGGDRPGPNPAATVLLPLPRPLGTVPGKETAYLAYRTQGVEAVRHRLAPSQRHQRRRLRPLLAGLHPARRRGDRVREYVPGRRRAAPGAAAPASARASPRSASQTVGVHVTPTQAQWRATVELSAPGKDLSLAQWDVLSTRPMTITRIHGPGVSRWVQSGGRLTVWFEKTTDSATVEMTGWVPLDLPAATAGKPPGDLRLDLPCLVAVHATHSSSQLNLTAASGITLATVHLAEPSARFVAAGHAGLPGHAAQPRRHLPCPAGPPPWPKPSPTSASTGGKSSSRRTSTFSRPASCARSRCGCAAGTATPG